MSYPRLGVKGETSGDFYLNFNWEYVVIKDINYIRVKPIEESFQIKSKYFQELFDKKQLNLAWQVSSHKTFFHKESISFDHIDIECSKISGNITVGYSLIAVNDFVLEPIEGEFNNFYMGTSYDIVKGTILSDDGREYIIKPQLLEFTGSSSIIRFKHNNTLPENFRIDFTTDKYITYSIKDKDFVDNLKTFLTRKKKIKNLIINNFFGPIYIEAIQRLSDEEELSWKDDLKDIINFDETKSEIYSDFEESYRIFDACLTNRESLLEESLKELNNIFLDE